MSGSMDTSEREIADYIARFKTPQSADKNIRAAFKIAARAIALKALSANYSGDYIQYLDRITSVVDTVMAFDHLKAGQKKLLATMIYVGTALDYKKIRPYEVEQAIRQFDLPDPHAIKMYDWAFGAGLSALDSNAKLVTTAWLLSDTENETHANYLRTLPSALKTLMKTVHQKNYLNTSDMKLPDSLEQRLWLAFNRILTL